MKRFFRSKIVLSLAALIMIAAAVAIPLSGSITRSHAQGAAQAVTKTNTATNYPVVFVHGWSSSSSTNCNDAWSKSLAFLQGTTSGLSPHFTGLMTEVGYYTNDNLCDVNLSNAGPGTPRDKCVGVGGATDNDIGTKNEAIEHLACELAWFIHDQYSQYDTNAELVTYSMGGLIARYAIYAVQHQLASFPSSLFVHDVVDFDTPNNGANFNDPTSFQSIQMQPGSNFLLNLKANAQNPQGSGWGTRWTMLGSVGGIGCDLVVSPESALYMDGGLKVVYQNPCYPHAVGTIFNGTMLQDDSTNLDATVYYCNNCPKKSVLNGNWQNWHTSSTYPHSIRKMYSSLFRQVSSAIVSVPVSSTNRHNVCNANTLGPSDDGSTAAIALPFTANFFGFTYSSVYVNNNGNVSFDTPLSDYTPYPFASTSHAIIAPFFADVDTRGVPIGFGTTTYGSGVYQGHATFCVNWVNVGYYNNHTDKTNSFQLLLVDRSDRRSGDFDIVMNYNQIQWETGDASGGSDGFGGNSARVGYSNGGTTSFEFFIAGSGISGDLLDVNGGLISNSQGSSQLGNYIFPVQNTGTAKPGKITRPVTPKPKP